MSEIYSNYNSKKKLSKTTIHTSQTIIYIFYCIIFYGSRFIDSI